jgi:hypothetical protein
MRLCDSKDTGRSLVHSGLPLAVACRRCGHRVLLKPGQVGAHEEDRCPLNRLPLLCRCGSKDVQRFLLETPDEAPSFLAGAPTPPPSNRCDDGLWRPTF